MPCLIAIRDCPVDEQNPFPTMQVYHTILEHFEGEDVQVIVIPDIESVNYGRGVGYEINEHVPPADIHDISATKIRAALGDSDD